MSIVKINALTVPEESRDLVEQRFAARQHAVDHAAGFEGFELLRPVKGEDRYFVVTRWKDEESFAAWRDGDAHTAHAQQEGEEPRKPAATGAELLEFEVVLESSPSKN
ncbi:antibiotic biosynthesis monooxygenase [Corynebacterium poyangense]|uniref:Antibiotic biosynthesis monooxygenase n=1 Tax=Corynebacterium poyangense TaxID=2684405 RepID=A0A7H0SRW0_9CORY|nr:antibiotic biosynthesis monooxygenase [Corynebacterium poyangense]MBZ8177225.1 antibiotic biosynthesis monooxygenase [Corynebacterium poyangense]QNQ91285.1 antibiotic biosynthesis monooxygenase [Corynebacterium poyangense]